MSIGWKYSNSSSYGDKLPGSSTVQIEYPPIDKYSVGTHLYSFWVNTDSTITASVTIKIVPVLDSITLHYSGDTSIPLGTSLDLSKLKVTANYNDDTSKNISGYTIVQDDLTDQWKKTITVSYTETDGGITRTRSKSFSVTVTTAAVKDLHITTAPWKTTYCLNDRFDPAGMVVEAVKTDGTLINPYTNYECTWSDDGSSCDNTGSTERERTVIITPDENDYQKGTVTAEIPVSVKKSAPEPHSLVAYDYTDSEITYLLTNKDRYTEAEFRKEKCPYVRIRYTDDKGYINSTKITDYKYSINLNNYTITLSYSLNGRADVKKDIRYGSLFSH